MLQSSKTILDKESNGYIAHAPLVALWGKGKVYEHYDKIRTSFVRSVIFVK